MAASNLTLVDVARAAGVGIGTVSRVINHGGAVKPATAELVRNAMVEIGYDPPPPEHRRGRRVGRSYPRRSSLGVMLITVGEQGLKWILGQAPVFSTVIHGIEISTALHGHTMVVRQAPTWPQLFKATHERGMAGIILIGLKEPEGPMPPELERTPVVWVMGSPQRFLGDHVQPDHVKIGLTAADYLLRHGHKHCAYLGSGSGTPDYPVAFRGGAFQWRIQQAGGQVEMLLDPNIIIADRLQNSPNEAVIAGLMDRLVALKPRPAALLLQADILAPTVYRHLIQRRIRPQEDITIVTCNNEQPYLSSLHPAPVVIDLQAESIGRRAVDQALWRTQNPRQPHVRIMVEPLLLDPANPPEEPK